MLRKQGGLREEGFWLYVRLKMLYVAFVNYSIKCHWSIQLVEVIKCLCKGRSPQRWSRVFTLGYSIGYCSTYGYQYQNYYTPTFQRSNQTPPHAKSRLSTPFHWEICQRKPYPEHYPVRSHILCRWLFSSTSICVCMCARVRVCMCVCVCV